MRRRWTEQEDQAIRYQYGRVPAREIANKLNRELDSVYRRARHLAVNTPMNAASTDQIRKAIEGLHPEGYSDNEIKSAIEASTGVRVDRHRIGKVRAGMGLASNATSDRQRARTRAKTAEQLQKAGLPSIGHLRAEALNKWKRELGWPETLTARAVQALELFFHRGPMTRLQLCDAMGLTKKQSLKRTEPVSNAKGGTVLAELQRASLVMRLRKQVSSGLSKNGRTRKVDLYLLEPGVVPDGKTRKTNDRKRAR